MEIGHSNAVIETINNSKMNISELVVIAYSSDDLNKLFPNLKCEKILYKVPFEKMYPLLFKMIFYYFYASFVTLLKCRGKYIKLGVGISYLWADVVNVQFVHKHWGEFYFHYLKKYSFKYFYKKTLFFFFDLFENFVYKNPQKRFSSLSKFTTQYLLENYPISNERITTAYSGINLEKFKIDSRPKIELKKELENSYPELKSLDVQEPIYLFVGAYERKGLHKILETLRKQNNAQLIIVGKPESGARVVFPENLKIFRIEFTKKLPMFYSLCDSFVFASIYEPFGLVIIEAAAMGLELFLTTKNVGACELLHNMQGVHLYEDHSSFMIEKIKVLSGEQRIEWRNQRIKHLQNYTWEQTGSHFHKLLESL